MKVAEIVVGTVRNHEVRQLGSGMAGEAGVGESGVGILREMVKQGRQNLFRSGVDIDLRGVGRDAG